MTPLSPMAAWTVPDADVRLTETDVHVWRVALDGPAVPLLPLLRTLSRDERARAALYHFERDRHRFIVGRGALRGILARYVARMPEELSFEYSPRGRPSLRPDARSEMPHFSVSHSAGLALIAVGRRQLGIDLEWIRSDLANDQIAERFFSPSEVAALVGLPRVRRVEAFFHCWTRKESYLKARGEGLAFPLDRFDVGVMPGEPAELSAHDDPEEGSRWSLIEIAPAPGWAAALAVLGRDPHVKCWQWA